MSSLVQWFEGGGRVRIIKGNNKLWKILREMGIPDHLTCLLRNLYAGQEATVRTGHGTTVQFSSVQSLSRVRLFVTP